MSLALSKTGWINYSNFPCVITHTLRRAYIAQLKKRHESKAACELCRLSDYELKDIGVPRSEIDTQVRFTGKN